jgi:glutamate dehydrogenase (NAD(P)+)
MEAFLHDRLPEQMWSNRLIRDGAGCYIEFSPLDVDRLARLGIEIDYLGPRLVVFMWDESSPLEIGGYLVIDNLAMGRPSMGGIRMLPDVIPVLIHNLARCMTLKNAAAELPFGGGKAGIVAERSLTPKEHMEIVSGFARLLYRYHDLFIPGPDVGTNDLDMKTIAIENGLDNVVSKPAEMGGTRIDQVGATAGGLVIALQTLLETMPRLKVLPQFANLEIPRADQITVLIQGYGAVGAHTSRLLAEKMPACRVVGVSDATGYLYDDMGLPVETLFGIWRDRGHAAQEYYKEYMQPTYRVALQKYSNSPNDLLREGAFCLIPAAPVSNYLDLDPATRPSMTVSKMGEWSVIIEGANTYSPEPARKSSREKLERYVYRQRGILIATDYLVNSGGVIFAAQERQIKTPASLRIPNEFLGKPQEVNRWLKSHAVDLAELSDERRKAAEIYRDGVIRRNIHEMIERLLEEEDRLPCEVSERISIHRIAVRERDRKAVEIMITMPTIQADSTVRDAASSLVEAHSPILAVIDQSGGLVGVITEWDITRAVAGGAVESHPLRQVMNADVIAANPYDDILEIIRKLEHHEISAMPVVENGRVLGMVTSDLLARRSLPRLLQTPEAFSI